jgi:hypothetical protein
MAKNNSMWAILVIIAIVGLLFYFKPFGTNIFALTGTETMTRTLPSTAEKGSSFSLTWNLVGSPTAPYGIFMDDVMTGGCKFSDGSTRYQGILFNPETTKTLVVTAPAAVGTCTFTGSYSLGNISTKSFTTQTVSIICTPVWTPSAWSACSAPACDWTGKDACFASYTSSGTQSRTATDSSACGVTTGQPSLSQSCTNSCTRTVLQNTLADTNCDNSVVKAELLNHLQRYIDGSVGKPELLNVLQAWINGGGL